ncbi:response regulator [Paenibacillus thalictri]|nr:response regulator [Paenibacillus thalictri]
MKAIIVDNEQPAIDLLKMMLEEDGRIEVAAVFLKPREAIEKLESLQPDVVFLDVDMPVMNGLHLAERIRESGEHTEIVFVSAYRQYALPAFQYNAVHYLLKPITREGIAETVKRLLQRKPAASTSAAPAATDCPPSIKAECLGSFRVTDASGRLVKWRTLKTEELMAYLLIKGRHPIPKWDIISDLWNDLPDEQAHSHLHTTLYKLKKTLKSHGFTPLIDFSSGHYHVDFFGINGDWTEFEAFALSNEPVTAASEAAYKRWIEDYKGDLFGKLDYPWSLPYRERFAGYYQRMVIVVSRYWIKQGEHWVAESALLNLLEHCCCCEEAYELLLWIYFERGDRNSLVRQFKRMKQVLQSELGVAPRPAIMTLYREMLGKLGN